MPPEDTTIPLGLCQCGCGQRTTLIAKNDPAQGRVKGTPNRFISGHNPRPHVADIDPPNPSGLCLCGCGQPTTLARKTSRIDGTLKGHPQKYLRGHQSKRFPERYQVDPDTGCWVWLGTKDDKGYGSWRLKGRLRPAHRVMYEELVGAIPDDMVIDHRCRNPSCVNPAHLEPVTFAENIRRGTHVKLTPELMAEIRRLHGTMSERAIARRLGLHHRTVSGFLRGRTWA